MAKETAIHATIVVALRRLLPIASVLHHSPNEGKRGLRAQQDLVRMGVRAGWPDLEIGYKGRMLFLEVKSADGSLSAAQRIAHKAIADAGFTVLVVRDAESAIHGVGEWLDYVDEQTMIRNSA